MSDQPRKRQKVTPKNHSNGADEKQIQHSNYCLLLPMEHALVIQVLIENGIQNRSLSKHATAKALLEASEMGNTDLLESLIDQGIDVDITLVDAQTALMKAASSGHCNAVKVLIQHGAGIDAKTENGETALMFASKQGHTDVVKVLTDYNVDMASLTSKAYTALTFAALNGHVEVVKILIENGMVPDWISVGFAMKNNHLEVVDFLLQQSNLPIPSSISPWSGLAETFQKAFISLASEGYQKSVEILLKIGCRDENGKTALLHAAENGHQSIKTFLLQNGADSEVLLSQLSSEP